MELSDIIPKSERNNFQDPIKHAFEAGQVCQNCEDYSGIEYVGKKILEILRGFKSKVKVGAILAKYKDNRAIEAFRLIANDESLLNSKDPTPGCFCGPECQEKDVFLTAMRLLANDVFIKLGDAAKFEDREILQYHATAMPEFRSGKFQL